MVNKCPSGSWLPIVTRVSYRRRFANAWNERMSERRSTPLMNSFFPLPPTGFSTGDKCRAVPEKASSPRHEMCIQKIFAGYHGLEKQVLYQIIHFFRSTGILPGNPIHFINGRHIHRLQLVGNKYRIFIRIGLQVSSSSQ